MADAEKQLSDAVVLVGGNEDLLALGGVGNMRIVTPRAFLEWLGRGV